MGTARAAARPAALRTRRAAKLGAGGSTRKWATFLSKPVRRLLGLGWSSVLGVKSWRVFRAKLGAGCGGGAHVRKRTTRQRERPPPPRRSATDRPSPAACPRSSKGRPFSRTTCRSVPVLVRVRVELEWGPRPAHAQRAAAPTLKMFSAEKKTNLACYPVCVENRGNLIAAQHEKAPERGKVGDHAQVLRNGLDAPRGAAPRKRGHLCVCVCACMCVRCV